MKTLVAALVLFAVLAEVKAENRYFVFDMSLKATTITDKDTGGVHIYNGEVKKTESFVKHSPSLRSYIIEDDWQMGASNALHLVIGKGYYEVYPATLRLDFSEENKSVEVDVPGKPRSEMEKGVGILSVITQLEVGDEPELHMVDLELSIVGNYSDSWKEVIKKGTTNEVEKFTFSGSGSGLGAEEMWTDSFPVKSAKLRYNSKLSVLLSSAYDEASGGTNDMAGMIAAADELNAFINKKAKIDDADILGLVLPTPTLRSE